MRLQNLIFLAVAPALTAQQPTVPPPESQNSTYNGVLFDAGNHNCGQEAAKAAPTETCPVSVKTTEFGLTASGKFMKFDEGGNQKAADALPKSKKGSLVVINYWRTGKTASKLTAHVTGTLTGDTLNVTTVRID